ncbi:MAG: DNA primase [Legionellales bacterium]|nr:DNA primase [Legionellales bacterium]|tara:strand:+ start:963 stop:2642 length:1680 start_codon:yes stop_codon:yes gene_type:complete
MPKTIIPKELIVDIVSKIDIVSLINQHVPLKKRGNNHIACCPFHQEKTPSFTVNQSKQFYHCFGCGAHGNAITFLKMHLGLSFIDAVKQLANSAGVLLPNDHKPTIPIESIVLKKIIGYYHQALLQNTTAMRYLKQRNLSMNTIKQFEIGYSNASLKTLVNICQQGAQSIDMLLKIGLIVKSNQDDSYYPRFRDRIIFPISDTNNLAIGLGGRALGNQQPKYLNSPQSQLFDKSQCLYALNKTKTSHPNTQHKSLLVVEGYMDVLSLHQHGFTNAVAAMGTSVTRKQIQILLQHKKSIAFCFDGDSAGSNAAKRTFENLLPELRDDSNVYFVFLPEQQDPDDVIQKHGLDQLKHLFKQALQLDEFLIRLIQADHDNDQLSDQIQRYNRAQHYIKQIQSTIIKELLTAKIKQHLKISHTPKPHQAITKQPKKTTTDFNHIACQILIKHPEYYPSIDKRLTGFIREHEPATSLNRLMQLIEQEPKQTPGQIIQSLDMELDQSAFLSQHQKEPSLEELNDIISSIVRASVDQQIKHIAKQNDPPAHAALKDLLLFKKALMRH